MTVSWPETPGPSARVPGTVLEVAMLLLLVVLLRSAIHLKTKGNWSEGNMDSHKKKFKQNLYRVCYAAPVN